MKLQNNYTTPEQSQRLLDLGFPVKSADCYYMIISGKIDNQIEVICDLDTFRDNCEYLRDYFPCWSVGRLIEIYNICVNFMPGMQLDLENEPESCTYIELIVSSFELAADDGLTYFSKLED